MQKASLKITYLTWCDAGIDIEVYSMSMDTRQDKTA